MARMRCVLACRVGARTPQIFLPKSLLLIQTELGEEMFVPALWIDPQHMTRAEGRRLKHQALALLAPLVGLPDKEAAAARVAKMRLLFTALFLSFMMAIAGLFLWTRSDAYQVKEIVAVTPGLIRHSDYVNIANWVRVLTLAGRTEEAISALGQTDAAFRKTALHDMAEVLESLGMKTQAEQVLRSVSKSPTVKLRKIHPWNIGKAREAGNLARQGEGIEAVRMALGIEDATYRHHTLVSVAKELLSRPEYIASIEEHLGDVSRIANVNRRIHEEDPEVDVLVAFAEAAAENGDTHGVEKWLQQAIQINGDPIRARDAGRRASNSARLAETLVAINRPERADEELNKALEAARSIQDPDFIRRRYESLSKVSEAIAWRGNFERAFLIAQEISEPTTYSETTARIAEILARAG